MGYVIGIDGGGTKTECLFQEVDASSRARGNNQDNKQLPGLIGEGCNPSVVGYQKMKSILCALIRDGLEQYSISPADVQGICIGLAGVDHKRNDTEVEQILLEMINKLAFSNQITYSICNDAHIALKGALPPDKNEGILVISGTGSIAYGIDHLGQSYRSGGWGHLLGDEGSGYSIGLQALQAVCKAFDQREEQTLLSTYILEQLNVTKETQLIPYMYSSPKEKKEIAQFAALVIQAAEQQDQVAMKILRAAADALVDHVHSLFKQNKNFDAALLITTAGSIFQHSTTLREYFAQTLHTRKLGFYVQPESTPVVGAVRIAVELLEKKNLI